MKTTRRKVNTTIATFLAYSVLQLGVQIALADPSPATPAAVQRQTVGRLTTRGNVPILVNEIAATTGTTITSGATIETKAGQSATVDLGPIGRLDISPNTRVVLTFNEQADLKALVLFGCVVLTANRNSRGEVATEKGIIGTTDLAVGGVIEMCYPPGADAPIVGQGVAVGAGAGAGAPAGAAAAPGGLFGIGIPATLAIIAVGTVAALPVILLQENPSPS